MDDIFTKPYDPVAVEKEIYKQWDDSGFFNPDKLPARHEKPFTIVMPPPNANGSLHVGHALFIAIQDVMTRYKRMQGYKALWIPGADHAGFETQVVYEKKLEKEGRSRFGMDPQELYKEIYDFTILNKAHMEDQVRLMGASCDWSREQFTLDPSVVRTVQDTFVKMHNDGLVYRGMRTVNWCPKHQTSLSDVETISVEEASPFYTFKYGPFEIGTVRPETKFGDKYVVVHPDDARYAQYEHGQTFTAEWINGPITATVIKDTAIDMEFGTGAMTITPWHSQVDFEIAERHGLDMEQIIDERGKLLPIAGTFAGMKIREARPLIVEALAAKGLLVSTDPAYKNVVKKCYKCEQMIEPQAKAQWFVGMEPLAKLALESLDRGEFRFIPDNYEKVFRYWMENTLDWNISRQIVWGIPVPAWFKDSEIAVGVESPGEGWVRDTDTFDTWFSSGQWPLIVTGYPNGTDLNTYYPTDVMETGYDLIFKWIPRMIMFGLYLDGRAPFKDIYMHGLVNDAQGKKMSKSKGNVINPIDMTDKYGTDALRMALIVANPAGSDLSMSEPKIKGYKNFANKIWNITRFVLSNTEGVTYDANAITTDADRTLLAEFRTIAEDITTDMDAYRFHLASEKIYHYMWHRLADEILEESKTILNGVDGTDGATIDVAARTSRQHTLLGLLRDSIRILHPFMPFVTEKIWAHLKAEGDQLLIVEEWMVR
jgi:valyl-tRNA synthetase